MRVIILFLYLSLSLSWSRLDIDCSKCCVKELLNPKTTNHLFSIASDCEDNPLFSKNGLTCSQLVTLEPSQCYRNDVFSSCCRSCSDAAFGPEGKSIFTRGVSSVIKTEGFPS